MNSDFSTYGFRCVQQLKLPGPPSDSHSKSRKHGRTPGTIAENYFRFAAAPMKTSQNRLGKPQTMEIHRKIHPPHQEQR